MYMCGVEVLLHYMFTLSATGGDVSDKKADEFTKKQNVLKKFEL